jgi:3'-5' exoribonuclease
MVDKHSEFPRQRLELGLVSALFHDIGRILTITHEMKRTSLGYNIDHDKLTFEVLSPHLRKFDQQWPDGANELRYLLTWKKGQKIPKYDMADLVSCCDRLSAGMGLQKRT